MSGRYGDYADDYYCNFSLNTEMRLPSSRETVLNYFEQLQKRFPTMQNLYCRDSGEHVLEELKDGGAYRWSTVESKRICAGYVNPAEHEDAVQLHETISEMLPYFMSVSPLDCDSFNVMLGFDFTYRGNHNELVAEALGVVPAFEAFQNRAGARLIAHEPSIQIALDEDCKTQLRLHIETRTNAFQIRTNDFAEEQLSVFLTARHYGSLSSDETYLDCLRRLMKLCESTANDYLIENVLVPLQNAIAIK